MCKNRLEHYATRQTITFNINKITKYERPAAECPRTLLYFKSECAVPASHKIYFLSWRPAKPFVCTPKHFSH